MLVLTRGKSEGVKVGEDVWVWVLEVNNGRVRLGFEAPSEVPILRDELVVDDQQRRAA